MSQGKVVERQLDKQARSDRAVSCRLCGRVYFILNAMGSHCRF